MTTKVTDKTLWFHTGTHKTGSTALQAYFASNKDRLGVDGVSYEFFPGEDIQMGNGQYLHDRIYARWISDDNLDKLLDCYFAGRATAICSSEDLTHFTQIEWRRIKESCSRLRAQVRIITFLRDIAPFYSSMHGQLIKCGDSYCSFADFSNSDQYYPVLNSLRSMLNVFGRETMTVLCYENEIDNLETCFMGALGLSQDGYDRSPLERPINRSLTEYEQKVLVRLNESTGCQYSSDFSLMLMSYLPNLMPVRHFDHSVLEILKNRHSEDLKWINEVFFKNDDILRISRINDEVASIESPDSVIQAIDRLVAEWAISKLKAAQENSIEFIQKKLKAIDWEKAGNLEIPVDFDPIAYLLLNPDVLKSKIPPYEHFLAYGRHEEGRSHKWTN